MKRATWAGALAAAVIRSASGFSMSAAPRRQARAGNAEIQQEIIEAAAAKRRRRALRPVVDMTTVKK